MKASRRKEIQDESQPSIPSKEFLDYPSFRLELFLRILVCTNKLTGVKFWKNGSQKGRRETNGKKEKKKPHNKRVFKYLLPYLRMIYKKDYDEKLKPHFLTLYDESQKKTINYDIVDKIPVEFIKEARRYRYPLMGDFILLGILIIFSLFLFFSGIKPSLEFYIGIIGVSGVLYGLLFAFIRSLAYNGPSLKSVIYLIDKKSINQSVANIATTLFFWILIFYSIQLIVNSIGESPFYNLGLLLSLPFILIFYRLRYDS